MKLLIANVLFGGLCLGCASQPKLTRPEDFDPKNPRGFYVRPEFPGSESVMAALRKHLSESQYIHIFEPTMGGDSQYDYAFFGAEWSIDFGFESVYHSSLIFAKTKLERDWLKSRIFIATEIRDSPFNGPIDVLEKLGRELGAARKPQKPNKAPEPTAMSVTSPAAQEPRQP